VIKALLPLTNEGGNEEFEAVLNELDTPLYEGLEITKFDSSNPSKLTPVFVTIKPF